MTAYEGGPTGFGLQAKTPAEDRAGEYYGKSYAMGTAMMDAWLDAWAKGWTYQCYLSFGQGRWWASHTSFAQGHRASPGFLVQTLINHTLANRDMLSLTVTGAPVLPVPDPVRGKKYLPGDTVPTRDVATIQAHAFADANSLAVAVVNLNLEKDQAVDLEVPLASAQKITLHTLTGGPRATNLDELKVSLAQSEVPVSVLVKGHFKTIVPAGSPLVVVFGK